MSKQVTHEMEVSSCDISINKLILCSRQIDFFEESYN